MKTWPEKKTLLYGEEEYSQEKNNLVFEFSGMACDILAKRAFSKIKKYENIENTIFRYP